MQATSFHGNEQLMSTVYTKSISVCPQIHVRVKFFRLFVDYHWKYGSFCRFWPLNNPFLGPKMLRELTDLLLQKKLYSSLLPAIIFVSKISQHCDVSGWKNFFGRNLSFLILNYCATCRCFSVIDTSKHSPCSIFSIDTIFVS